MQIKRKKVTYILLSAIGGGLIGYFANQLSTIFGIVLFTLGVFLLVFCCIKITK